MHERAHGEPETIPHGELILDVVVVQVARMFVAPFVGRETSQDHHDQADEYVRDERVHPDLERERIEEREEARLFTPRHFVEYADSQVEEWLRKVNYLLTFKVNREC